MALPAGAGNVIVVGKKGIPDYVLAAILLFNEGHEEVVIRGHGQNINKAVDIYNALAQRLKDSLELVEVKIDSVERGKKLVPFIEIRVRRKIV